MHVSPFVNNIYYLAIAFFFQHGVALADSSLLMLENPQRHSFTGFASSLAIVGDLDHDGVGDYLTGAYQYRGGQNTKRGRAFVLSGRNGRALLTLNLPSQFQVTDVYGGAAFGCAVAAANDVDRDGTPDFIVGAFGLEGSGRAFVFSGKRGKLLHVLKPPKPQLGGGFGWSVASLPDLNGDNIADLLVGAFAQDSTGRVFVFSGANGTLLHSLVPPAPASSGAFGWSVAAGGDLDKDGTADILVGAPYTSVGDIAVQGRVYLFSGRTQQLLSVLDDPQPRAGEVFGWHVSSAGDLNNDGIADVLVGAPYKDVGPTRSEGAAFVFNGADGKLLLTLKNPVPRVYAGFGLVATVSPDLNHDGIPEILIGAPYQTVDQFHVQGEVFLFDGVSGRHLTTFDNPLPHQGSAFGYTVVAPGDVDGDSIPDFAIGAAGQTIRADAAVGRIYVFRSRSGRVAAAQADATRPQ